jgi:hypothetical protein
MYLALGEDYAYNIAGRFANGLTKKNQWNDKQIREFHLRTLMNKTGPLSSLLNDMEKKKLLISRKDFVGKPKRKYFSVNPVILLSPDGSKNYFVPSFYDPTYYEIQRITYRERKISELSEKEIKDFLQELEKEKPTGKDADSYFDKRFQWWCSIKRFDYITFLKFLQEEANMRDKKDLTQHFGAYIGEIIRLESDKRRIRTLECQICVNIVDSTPDGQRVQALEELASKGDQAASDELIQLLSSDDNRYAIMKAARALGRLHEIRAVEQLKRACDDDTDEKVRKAATEALEKMGERTHHDAKPPCK